MNHIYRNIVMVGHFACVVDGDSDAMGMYHYHVHPDVFSLVYTVVRIGDYCSIKIGA